MKQSSNNSNVIIPIVSILLSFVSGTIGSYLVITNIPKASQNIIKNVSEVNINENSISPAVDKLYDSVVVIMSYNGDKLIATGTGFAYKESKNKSYIMTNNHVVEGANKIDVVLSNGETVESTLIGGEKYSDIAILTTKSNDNLQIATIGDSSKSNLGDTVFTIGSPMGINYSGTVTKGILSGKDRLVEVSFSGSTSDYYMKVLQTDAAINPGNSGGPLANIDGKVIGINSLKLVEDEIEGMGFAIPIEDAINYAKTIEEGGTVKRPFLGVGMVDITDSYYLWQKGIKIPSNIDKGVVIIEVEASSPASKSGLQVGDIITGLDDEDITSLAQFRYELYKHNSGDTITITYSRSGKEAKTKVTLIENNN